MTKFAKSLVAAILGLASPAAAQPFSQSMAQCAGLYAGMVGIVEDPALAAQLETMDAMFRSAAVETAQAEGQGDPEAWVTGHYAAAHDEWAAKGLWVTISQEFYDWSDYCTKFGRAQGIALPKG